MFCFYNQIRPVGKITVSEKPTEPDVSEPNPISSANSDEECEPVVKKKIKKEIDDRRFTIETTVTVKKLNKKLKKEKK